MTADAQPKLPPVRLARAFDSARRRLRRFERKLQPPDPASPRHDDRIVVAQAVYTATKLGIVDALRDGPLTAEAIAERVGANPDAREPTAAYARQPRRFHPAGRWTVRTHTDWARRYVPMCPTLLRGLVLFWADPLHWEHWGQLSYSVRTGISRAIEELRGKPMFDWLDGRAGFRSGVQRCDDEHVEYGDSASGGRVRLLLLRHDRGRRRRITACYSPPFCAKWPQTRGILFDADSVVVGAPAVLDAAGVSDRCSRRRRIVLRIGARRAVTPMCSSTSSMTGMTTNHCRSCATFAPR